MNLHLRKKLFYGVLLTLIFPISLTFADTAPRILFVCGGNTGRSVIAENLANEYFNFPAAGYQTFSRGLHVNSQQTLPEKNAVTVMRQWNHTTTIEMHRATPVTVADINEASIVLAMTTAQKEKLLNLDPSAADKIFLLSQCANGTTQDVNDMYGHDLAFYQQTSKKIAYYLRLIKDHGFSCQDDITKQIHLSFNTMENSWNHGDLKTFLTVYNPSTETIYVSSTGNIIHGFDAIAKRFYTQYPTTEKMGYLVFSDITIRVLSENYATAIGKWHLTRKQDSDIGGVFSLLYKKTDQGWKIELDHTS